LNEVTVDIIDNHQGIGMYVIIKGKKWEEKGAIRDKAGKCMRIIQKEIRWLRRCMMVYQGEVILIINIKNPIHLQDMIIKTINQNINVEYHHHINNHIDHHQIMIAK